MEAASLVPKPFTRISGTFAYVALPGAVEWAATFCVHGPQTFRRCHETQQRLRHSPTRRYPRAAPLRSHPRSGRTGCLHLKSAVTCLGRHTLLANRAWFDQAPFSGYGWVDVDPAEPHAANALALGDTVIFPASFPRTRARVEAQGFHVTPLDISELQKAESGLTCSSLIFEA